MPIVKKALEIVKTIQKIAHSADSSNNDALRKYWKEMDELISEINGIVIQCNFILQQPATKGAGPATPQTPVANTTSAAVSALFCHHFEAEAIANLYSQQLAVESSRRLVDQTRGNLEAARDSYDRAANRLVESQSQLSRTIAEMTSLNLTNAGLKAMLPILKQAVGAFTSAPFCPPYRAFVD